MPVVSASPAQLALWAPCPQHGLALASVSGRRYRQQKHWLHVGIARALPAAAASAAERAGANGTGAAYPLADNSGSAGQVPDHRLQPVSQLAGPCVAPCREHCGRAWLPDASILHKDSLMKAASVLLVPLLLLSACGRDPAPTPASGQPAPAGTPAAEAVPADSNAAAPAAGKQGFDLQTLAVSDVPLGAFPYLQLPSGYQVRKVLEKRFDRLPFWTGDHLQWVQGKVWSADVHTPAKTDDFSLLELQANLDAVIAQAGGHLVTRSVVPPDAIKEIEQAPGQILVNYNAGLSGIFGETISTWVIRRADHDIWVYLGGSGFSGGLTIVESQPVAITASLLPADALKQALAQTGKVDIQVNFATDSAQILPASQPQIAQVSQLLAADPALRLAINGHTDNSGSSAHNLQLSQQRAASVAAALVAAGIAADRLSAEGFGDSRPVADNSTAEGKAKNRRVELVRQ
jgi:OOP family OmpA-OmpF porin